MANKSRLLRLYKELLLDGIMPFWECYGVDHTHGGVLSCMEEDGRQISTNKYVWSQARWVWVCSAIYNRIERNPRFLEWARSTIDFLLRHGRDGDGRWVYSTTRQGQIIEGATSIYSDCFVIYGLSEYYRAVPDEHLLGTARSTFAEVEERIESPDFRETAPYPLPANRRNHGVPMILTEVANELAHTTKNAALAAAADMYSRRVLEHFVRPERKCLLEFLDREYREVPSPEGTFVMPGHAIESMWFTLHRALARDERRIIPQAAEVIRWHLEKGWDPEYGGLFLGIDAEGHSPFLPHHDTKAWWPHTEALYALLLTHALTGEAWCERWYDQMHEWAFHHFPLPGAGEWRQRLDRTGRPISTVIALPVKDPFHLPRALILGIQLLERGLPQQ